MDTKLLSTDRPIALYYAFVTNVQSYTENGESKCQVTLTGDWNQINTTIGTIKLQEFNSESDAGTFYTSNLSATVPGEDENSPENTRKLSGRKVLLRVDYRSGLKKIIGAAGTGPKVFISTETNTTTKRNLTAEFKYTEPNRWLL